MVLKNTVCGGECLFSGSFGACEVANPGWGGESGGCWGSRGAGVPGARSLGKQGLQVLGSLGERGVGGVESVGDE